MSDADLAFAGIARQAEMLAAGEVSSRRLVDLYLERIERLNPKLNAFTDVLAERARAEAEAADARIAAGERAPLLGVPIAIKDIADVEGVVTRYGTDAFGDRPATADAEIVRRLRGAGAVILAKTTLPELAICGFTESKTTGVTRNPWDTGRTTGGSSGGSGAAVAAGLVGAAHASDGGGSIRIPAAFNGLFGLKPQRGRVPLEPPEHWNQMSVNGCVTRTVADSALFLDVVTEGGGDPGGPPPPEISFTEAARTEPGTPQDRDLRERRARRRCRRSSPTRSSAGSPRSSELLRARPRRPPPRADVRLAGQDFVTRYLGGIHDEIATRAAPGAARAANARVRPARARSTRGRARPGDREASRRLREDRPQLARVRRPRDADDRRAAVRGRQVGGEGRAARRCSG